MQLDRLVAVLEQEVQLAEDLREVGPVDLVDDQDERLVRMVAGVGRPMRRSGPGRSSNVNVPASVSPAGR